MLLVGKNYIVEYFTKFSCMFEQLLYRQVDLVHPNLLDIFTFNLKYQSYIMRLRNIINSCCFFNQEQVRVDFISTNIIRYIYITNKFYVLIVVNGCMFLESVYSIVNFMLISAFFFSIIY